MSSADLFKTIHFRGEFRDYQRKVLDNADSYLKDGKINIVAAPGSGKTVLGLELICRLKSPCIILSPTTAIRQQWGERLKDMFLGNKDEFDNVFSTDLHTIRLINSITYQALYSAIEKVSVSNEDETDYSNVDLLTTIKECGIKTICLDEAHHLKNEWQKSLEKFLDILDSDVKIISLTATPPYDSESAEWNRYTNICGEIDEEIFIPELVGQNTLCPHQDYIYFNYPTETEKSYFDEYQERALTAISEIGSLPIMEQLWQTINVRTDYEVLFSNVNGYISLLTLLQNYGFEINKKLINELTIKKRLPRFDMKLAETALQFLIESELISKVQKEELLNVLKKNQVFEKRRVVLTLNEKLKRTLLSSVGKLESIRQIANSEFSAMNDKLRMLILTDYIKRETLSKVGTAEGFDSVNIVSIFEVLRRDMKEAKIGVLSGTLVILPDSIDLSGVEHRKKIIPGTSYCTVEFSTSNHHSVDYISSLFEKGELQILIGTKSLLGEGWDSPCINSLILASFIGSFVQSNQMRGRAIRLDKNNRNKVSNIWHLVTVEPEYLFKDKPIQSMKEYLLQDHNVLTSYDFEIVKRRFDYFMGPNYTTGDIESGIERITALLPPFDKAGIDHINQTMLTLSKNREDIVNKWEQKVINGEINIFVETETPVERRVPVFTFSNVTLTLILAALETVLSRIVSTLIAQGNISQGLILTVIIVLLAIVLYQEIKKILIHSNPARSIKTLGTIVYRTLCECDLISQSARIETTEHKALSYISLRLRNASIRDQNRFNLAMREMLSPIDNPRYILIAKNKFGQYNYKLSFACPSIIAKKKEYAKVLADNLKSTTGNFELLYTHRKDGLHFIFKCRKYSYISRNERIVGRKYKAYY